MEQTYVYGRFGLEAIRPQATSHKKHPGSAPLKKLRMEAPMCADAGARVVLVVEDEALLRASIADELRTFGWEVLEAASGEHALTLMTNNQVDVVVTDIQLAGVMSGWETAKAMRETSPDVLIVYTSGYGCDPARQVAGSLFIGKPYEPSFIIEACHDLLSDIDEADQAREETFGGD